MIKNRFFFLAKKIDIQSIISMIMITCSSERMFNPMCYSGYIIGIFKVIEKYNVNLLTCQQVTDIWAEHWLIYEEKRREGQDWFMKRRIVQL